MGPNSLGRPNSLALRFWQSSVEPMMITHQYHNGNLELSQKSTHQFPNVYKEHSS